MWGCGKLIVPLSLLASTLELNGATHLAATPKSWNMRAGSSSPPPAGLSLPQSSSSPLSAPPHGAHLNAVLDFGAVSDGVCTNMSTSCTGTDNSRALQAAIDAAQRDGRALYIPPGRYMITRTLVVGCATPATTCPGCKPTGDAGGCVEPNATEGVWGLHPLIMTGAGRSLTTIGTVRNIHALVEFAGPTDGGTLGKSSILHDLRDLAFDAGGGNSCPNCKCRYSSTCGQANFSIYASAITRSHFTRLSFYNAKVAAVSLAYGWINRIRDSLFSDNNIGLHVWNQCNNIDVTGNNFYGNHLPLVVEDGAQIQISGNVIEGSQCPGIVASSIYGLLISSNYFESNNMCGDCALHCNVYQVGSKESDGSFNVSINADIVLNGVIDNAGDPTWSFGTGNALRDRAISSEFPCRSVIIEGGYHSPKAETKNGNGSMVLIGAVQGALIRGNDCGGGGQCKNMAVVTTGTDATLWAARDISLEKNTGWDYTGGSVRLVPSPKCLRPWDKGTRIGVQTGQGLLPWSCEGRLDTVSDAPALCSGTNIGYGTGDNDQRQRPYTCTNAPPTSFVSSSSAHPASVPGFSEPSVDATTPHDGHAVHRISAPTDGAPGAAVVVAELPLASMPSAAGHSVHFTVLARTVKSAFHHQVKGGWNTTMATLILLIDRGDGVWISSNGGALAGWGDLGAPAWMDEQWDVRSFATQLGWEGTARMAIVCAAGGEVDVAWVKVAPVGASSQPMPLSPHTASGLALHADADPSAGSAADAPAQVYGITTFSQAGGFNIYTLPVDLSTPPQLVENGRLGYPQPGGVPTFTADPLQGERLTEYVQWSPSDLRDHTLFAHNSQLFAVCTTSWGHPGDGRGGSGSGYGNFHILKRKRRGSWVLHSRVVVPHTLATNHSAPTSTLWSPIPFKFGDAVAIFVSATRGPPNFTTVMLWMNDDLTGVVAQADLTTPGNLFEFGRRPSSRFISYQPFDRLDGNLGVVLKDEAYSEFNRSTAVPNRIVLQSNLSANVVDQQFSYFDQLAISGCLLMVEAHTIFPEPVTSGYRVFYSVFECRKLDSACSCNAGQNEPSAPSVRSVWCDAKLLHCRNDTMIVADGNTLGLVTKIDSALLS